MDQSKELKDFCIDIVIDLHPPDGIDPESGEDVIRCAAAAAGCVWSWLSDYAVMSSHGFPFGERERRVASEFIMEHLTDYPTGPGVYRFDVPPYWPSAAEMSPDAILLPQQSETDMRILLFVRVSTELSPEHAGDELFRMACELKETVTESSRNAPHMKVHRVDVAPMATKDEETMQRFLDSHIEPDHQ